MNTYLGDTLVPNIGMVVPTPDFKRNATARTRPSTGYKQTQVLYLNSANVMLVI